MQEQSTVGQAIKKNGVQVVLPVQNKQLIKSLTESSYIRLEKRIQQKIQRVFRDFSFHSITFYIFLVNCLTWLAVHITYWTNPFDWNCMQYIFFAKFQPSITYQFEVWRLVLSSFMFNGWMQFYFNNFGLNMLGYSIEKRSKIQFMVIFYGGILAGHMLSCCLSKPDQLTVGTSCGTIALLPIQIMRYIKLRRTNPIQAISRRRFLIFNIISNFILNILAIFHLQPVDWISHVGCIIAGLIFMIYYEVKEVQIEKRKQIPAVSRSTIVKLKMVRILTAIILGAFYFIMGLVIWVYLPGQNIGRGIVQCNNN